MQLSNEAIEAFRSAYQAAYGEDISAEGAARRARQVLALYEAIYCVLAREAAPGYRPSIDDPARTPTLRMITT
jgi:hypothetical protein